jgi:hypothetical protein
MNRLVYEAYPIPARLCTRMSERVCVALQQEQKAILSPTVHRNLEARKMAVRRTLEACVPLAAARGRPSNSLGKRR